MARIDSHQAFQQALAELSVRRQRQIGARFIGNVLDLTPEPRFRNALAVLEKPNLTAEELVAGFQAVHSVYVATHPRSDLSELNYARQAEHFIAEACLVCLSPIYEETKVQRIAEKAAMYCRMARTCAAIRHDQDVPQLADSEQSLAREIQTQYRLLNDFLADK